MPEARTLTPEQVARRVHSLPTLPSIIAELSRRMDDPKTSSEDLAQVIAQDQTISSKVLKLVNSPFYGFPGRIHTISQGIVILGFNAIKNLVLSTSVFEAFRGASSGDLFRTRDLWIHCASVAATARMLAAENALGDPEEAFVAGLLHDIGKLLFWTTEPQAFEACLRKSITSRIPLSQVERAVFGCTDADLGAALAESWRFPDSLRDAILWRETPRGAGPRRGLAAAVHCANVLCTALDHPATPGATLPVPDPAAWDLAGLREDDALRRRLRSVAYRQESAVQFVSATF